MATRIEPETIEDVVDTVFANKKTCTNLFACHLISATTAEYIADRLNAIFDDNNEIHSLELMFLLRDTDNDSNEAYLGKFSGCYDEEYNALDVDEIYPDKIVLEYYLPEFMMEEYEVQDSITSNIMDYIADILEGAELIPDGYKKQYSHPEELEYCSSDHIFSLKLSW